MSKYPVPKYAADHEIQRAENRIARCRQQAGADAMANTKPSERAMAAAKALVDDLNAYVVLEDAAAIIDAHFRLPELTGEMSSRAVQAGLDIAQLGHETENIVQWGDAARIIDEHFRGYGKLFLATDLSAMSAHSSTCAQQNGPCFCHVGEAEAALAAAKEPKT
jgi:hypothetical protein